MTHSTVPLNDHGSQSGWLHARATDSDLARLAELAEQHGGNRSEVARQALRIGLDQLERDTGPPSAA